MAGCKYLPASNNWHCIPFKYEIHYNTIGGTINRPFISASIDFNGNSCRLPLLVDTGSDKIVLPSDYKDLLVVSDEQCSKHKLQRAFGSTQVDQLDGVYISFPDIDSSKIFTCSVSFGVDSSYGILGREIIDKLSLGFRHYQKANGEVFYISFEDTLQAVGCIVS